jgi:hypothetical protein
MHRKPQHLFAADRHFLVNALAMVVKTVQDPIFVVSTHFNWAPLPYGADASDCCISLLLYGP